MDFHKIRRKLSVLSRRPDSIHKYTCILFCYNCLARYRLEQRLALLHPAKKVCAMGLRFAAESPGCPSLERTYAGGAIRELEFECGRVSEDAKLLVWEFKREQRQSNDSEQMLKGFEHTGFQILKLYQEGLLPKLQWMEHQIEFAFRGTVYPEGSRFIYEFELLEYQYCLLRGLLYWITDSLPEGNADKSNLEEKFKAMDKECFSKLFRCQYENQAMHVKARYSCSSKSPFSNAALMHEEAGNQQRENIRMHQDLLLELLSSEILFLANE